MGNDTFPTIVDLLQLVLSFNVKVNELSDLLLKITHLIFFSLQSCCNDNNVNYYHANPEIVAFDKIVVRIGYIKHCHLE